jgi:S1-C subfamily serine protease
VLVTEVVRGGPADRAGIERGDLLLSAAGQPLRGVDDLLRWLSAERVGEAAEILLLRRGDLRRLRVVPTEKL